jgi:hypothetical protein
VVNDGGQHPGLTAPGAINGLSSEPQRSSSNVRVGPRLAPRYRDTMAANGSRDGGAVSRTRVAVLAATSTLASVLATEVHGVAIGIMAGCATFAAGAEAWSSSTRWNKKNGHHPHVITKKISRMESDGVRWRRLETVSCYLQMSQPRRFAARLSGRWVGRGLLRSRVGPEDAFCGAVFAER